MPSKNKRARPAIHPKNKYADNSPDFHRLASLYPSFKPFVFYARNGRPRIDWTDYNATRELTRILLLHDHALDWWIPDGQLCPTVPNRSNYIHWIEDLLSSDIIQKSDGSVDSVRGFDIGTGANCIYPLLGASLLGWRFVGSDITDIALEWAERNVKSNPHISDLIEIRRAESPQAKLCNRSYDYDPLNTENKEDRSERPSLSLDLPSDPDMYNCEPPILLGVVHEGEKFDFCMCNPPFFESIEEAGLNPKTSCGGTPEEMVCHGGENAFIIRLIEDSVKLKQSFRWYTSMVGKKSNLKVLTSKLREVGVTIVKTTEFVQGRTCRWGLAWSFVQPTRKMISPCLTQKSAVSFMLEGIQRRFNSMDVLQSIEAYFRSGGLSCKMNASSFCVDVNASKEQCGEIINSEQGRGVSAASELLAQETNLSFRVSVFQQIPGTLLVKGFLQDKDSPLSGIFSMLLQKLEEMLRSKYCR